MRRFDKKIAMRKANLLFEQRSNPINESIRPEEAYSDYDAMMTVLKGKRSVAFLLGPTVEQWYDKYIKDNDSVNLIVVERDGTGIYGDAYILYSDLAKANRLKSVTDKHDGYLSDDTPEEAIENGEALEYADADIKTFVDSHYGNGSYDKAKNHNLKVSEDEASTQWFSDEDGERAIDKIFN